MPWHAGRITVFGHFMTISRPLNGHQIRFFLLHCHFDFSDDPIRQLLNLVGARRSSSSL